MNAKAVSAIVMHHQHKLTNEENGFIKNHSNEIPFHPTDYHESGPTDASTVEM